MSQCDEPKTDRRMEDPRPLVEGPGATYVRHPATLPSRPSLFTCSPKWKWASTCRRKPSPAVLLRSPAIATPKPFSVHHPEDIRTHERHLQDAFSWTLISQWLPTKPTLNAWDRATTPRTQWPLAQEPPAVWLAWSRRTRSRTSTTSKPSQRWRKWQQLPRDPAAGPPVRQTKSQSPSRKPPHVGLAAKQSSQPPGRLGRHWRTRATPPSCVVLETVPRRGRRTTRRQN